jgi:hypothetical protein
VTQITAAWWDLSCFWFIRAVWAGNAPAGAIKPRKATPKRGECGGKARGLRGDCVGKAWGKPPPSVPNSKERGELKEGTPARRPSGGGPDSIHMRLHARWRRFSETPLRSSKRVQGFNRAPTKRGESQEIGKWLHFAVDSLAPAAYQPCSGIPRERRPTRCQLQPQTPWMIPMYIR